MSENPLPPKTTKPIRANLKIPVTIRMEPDMIGALDLLANTRGYNRSEVVVRLLEWALKARPWEKVGNSM